MSERDFAKSLIDRVPENRLFYVIAYLQGAAIPDNAPNSDTLESAQNAAQEFFKMLDDREAGQCQK